MVSVVVVTLSSVVLLDLVGPRLPLRNLTINPACSNITVTMLSDAPAIRDELVDFEWKVARDGYRVIQVAPDDVLHTNAEAPGLPAGQVYEDPDRVMAEEAAVSGLPAHMVQMVTTVAAEYRYWVRAYAPLTDEPALFRTFADLPATPEVIVAFADRYGMLGGAVVRRFLVPDSDEIGIGIGEPIEAWRDAIRDIRRVVQTWDRARESDPHRPRWQRPEKVTKVYRSGLCHNVAAVLRERWRPDVLPNVQRAINAKLSAETSARMLWDREEGRLRLHLRPASLLGALWLQLAQAIDGNADYRRCRVCAAWFELHPDRNRTSRAYCGDACRVKAYRGRQARARELRAKGQDMEGIARELGSDVETIRKWTGGSDG